MFVLLLVTSASAASTKDALRCNKVYNDNYYYGQTCTLIDKTIDGESEVAADDDPFVKTDQIKTVIFENSKVIYIPPQLFTKFRNVERVYVNGTGLETVTGESFRDARATKEIYLNQNAIRSIGAATFSKVIHLSKLDLSSNLIEALDDDAFAGLSQLRQLYLNFNRLTTVSTALFTPLISINILDLSNNNIDTFVDAVFAYNRQVQNISLAVNSIKILSLDLRDNILLQTLDVSSNVIEGASIQRKPTSRGLTFYASHNQWQCEALNSTLHDLEHLNIFLKPKPGLDAASKANIHGIECHDPDGGSFFDFGSSGSINWPIVAFVIACGFVFIIGALAVMVCCRRRSRLYNYINVLSK